MALVNITDVGRYGVVKDLPSRILPPGAWTDASNVLFRGTHIQQTYGHSTITIDSGAMVAPYGAFIAGIYAPNFNAVERQLINCSLTKANVILLGTSPTQVAAFDLTRNPGGDYTMAATDQWNYAVFNNQLIANNSVDDPQFWNFNAATKFAAMTNWPANTKTKCIRSFKNFLIALDVTKTTTRYQRMVKWSHSADTGLPSTWDETDTTKDAGENNLPMGSDIVVDCLPLGDVNGIYTETETWRQSLSGTSLIFDFYRRFHTSGILGQGCVAEVLGRHFVVTQDDIVLHDFVNIQSLLDRRLRNWLFSQIDTSKYYLSKVAVNTSMKEVWFCYPASGAGNKLNRAIIWNWLYDTWQVRDLIDVRQPVAGPVNFLVAIAALQENTIYLGDITNVNFRRVDDGHDFSTSNITSTFERENLDVKGAAENGQIVLDPHGWGLLREIWPRFEGNHASTQLSVTVYTRDTDSPAVAWTSKGTSTFTSASEKMDLSAGPIPFRFLKLAWSVVDSQQAGWKFTGYALDIEPLGGR